MAEPIKTTEEIKPASELTAEEAATRAGVDISRIVKGPTGEFVVAPSETLPGGAFQVGGKEVTVPKLPGGTAEPESPVGGTDKIRAEADKMGADITAGLAEFGIEKPESEVDKTVKDILDSLKTRQEELRKRETEDTARIEKEFETAVGETERVQKKEFEAAEGRVRIGGFFTTMERDEIMELQRSHRLELAGLRGKKEAALTTAKRAYADQDFALAQAQLETAMNLEKDTQKKKQDYFDNVIKMQEYYSKLNKPLKDAAKADQDLALSYIEAAPSIVKKLGIKPSDIILGDISVGEITKAYLDSPEYAKTLEAAAAKEKTADMKEYEAVKKEGYKGTFQDWLKLKATQFGTEKGATDKPTPSAGFFDSDIEADVRERFSTFKQAGKTEEEMYGLLRDFYSPQEVSDPALKKLIGIEEPKDIPPSAEETAQSWFGSFFSEKPLYISSEVSEEQEKAALRILTGGKY